MVRNAGRKTSQNNEESTSESIYTVYMQRIITPVPLVSISIILHLLTNVYKISCCMLIISQILNIILHTKFDRILIAWFYAKLLFRISMFILFHSTLGNAVVSGRFGGEVYTYLFKLYFT